MGKNIRRGRGHDAAFELRRVYHVARIGMDRSRSGAGRHVASEGVAKIVEHGGCNRSEERRVGKECVSSCRSRWSTYHSKKKNIKCARTTHFKRRSNQQYRKHKK